MLVLPLKRDISLITTLKGVNGIARAISTVLVTLAWFLKYYIFTPMEKLFHDGERKDSLKTGQGENSALPTRRCVVLHVGFIFSIIRRRVVTLLLAQQTDGQTTKQFYRDYWLTVIGNIAGLKPGYPLIKSNLFREMFSSGSKIFNRIKS